MRLVKARLTRRATDDLLVEIEDHVPLGRLYTVDLDSAREVELQHVSGVIHKKHIIDVYETGCVGWFVLDLLTVEES